MKLLIVESPSKARKIAGFLGGEYKVEASCGHIMELPENQLGVDVDHGFVPSYVLKQDKHDVVKKIRSLAMSADEIFVAADPDREGEFIGWSVVDTLDPRDKKKCKRITYHEITKKAVLEAISKPRKIDDNLVNAAKARQVLDRLIGFKCSPILWGCVGRGTSAGRVQSVALKLVCDRQREIEDFKPVTYWYDEALYFVGLLFG